MDFEPTWADLKRYDDENRALRAEVERLRTDLGAAIGEGHRLLLEVEKLRGLIAKVEWAAGGCAVAMMPLCPWCEALVTSHSIDCPAFSARGEVRR